MRESRNALTLHIIIAHGKKHKDNGLRRPSEMFGEFAKPKVLKHEDDGIFQVLRRKTIKGDTVNAHMVGDAIGAQEKDEGSEEL